MNGPLRSERARARSMQHEAGGEDADRRARGLSLPCRAAYTQPERPKGMRERSANSVMLPVLRTGRSLTQWSALLSECYPTGRKWPKVCKCVLCGAVTVTRRTHAAQAGWGDDTTRPALDGAREVHTPLRYVRSRIGGCGVQLVTQAV